MKHYLIAAIVGALPTAAASKPVEDVQLWSSLIVTGTVVGDIVYQGEVQSRIVDNISRYGQTQVRGAVGVKANDDVTLFIGYARFDIDNAGTRDGAENRLYQQASVRLGDVLGGTLATRIRLEERWIRGVSGTSWRYRQQLRYQRPFRKDGPALIVASEIFFTLNSKVGGPRGGFDQVRGLVGVSVPVSKAVSIDAGYQPIYMRANGRDRLNHTVPIVLSVKL
jgi:Protein of unknown function (DUF2490)